MQGPLPFAQQTQLYQNSALMKLLSSHMNYITWNFFANPLRPMATFDQSLKSATTRFCTGPTA